MHDNTVFCDKQQQNYVPTSILMALYFGCRPVSMFDTRSRFAGKDHACNLSDYITGADRSENGDEDPKAQHNKNSMDWDDNRVMFVNSDGELASHVDRSTYWETATAAPTMASMQAWMRPDLYFGDISLSSLLLTVSSESLTSSSPR